MPDTLSPDESSPPEPVAPGDRVGRFVVLERVGAGGMGVVFAAYDPTLDRKVAIKFLRAGRSDPASEQRLMREAQALARLQHPNVVTVHEVGSYRGRVFLAMEFVDGHTARDWLTEPRALADALDVFVKAGRGLAAAHAAGLVHRDFKPHNVMLGTNDRVLVTDFGIVAMPTQREGAVAPTLENAARPAFASAAPGQTLTMPTDASETAPPPDEDTGTAEAFDSERTTDALTRTGAVIGTPAYMAPEQLAGGNVDARADQYAFCVSLFEAVVGARPGAPLQFPAEARIPRWLQHALRRGLAHAPADRFESMDALLTELGADRSRRRVALVAVGAAALIAAGTVGVLARSATPQCERLDDLSDVWSTSIKSQLRAAFDASGAPGASSAYTQFARGVDAYVADLGSMRRDNCRATRERGEQTTAAMDLRTACLRARQTELEGVLRLVSTAPEADLVSQAPEMPSRFPSLERCRSATNLSGLQPAPTDSAFAAAETTLADARALLVAGEYIRAKQAAVDLLPTLRAAHHDPTLARALLLQGEAAFALGDDAEADTALREAVVAADRGRDDAARAGAYTTLIEVTGVRLEKAREGALYSQLAFGAIERVQGGDDLRALAERATAYFHMWHGNFDDALAHANQAVALSERAFGPDDARTARAVYTLGVVLSERREHEPAGAAFERAHDVYVKALGQRHPLVAKTLNSQAIVASDLRDRKRAEALYRDALAMYRATNARPADIAGATMNLANNLGGQGRHEEALALYTEAGAGFAEHLGKDHTRYADVLENKASTLTKLERFDEAEPIFRESIAIREARVGRTHPVTANTIRMLGRNDMKAGRYDRALGHFEQVVAIYEKLGGPDSPQLVRVLLDIGEVYDLRKDWRNARRTYARGHAMCEAHPDMHGARTCGDVAHNLFNVMAELGDHAAAKPIALRAAALYRASGNEDWAVAAETYAATGKRE